MDRVIVVGLWVEVVVDRVVVVMGLDVVVDPLGATP